MESWLDLTDEQYAVIITAYDEAAIADILVEFHARRWWTTNGTAEVPPALDLAARQAMVPHFAPILADMVELGWVDLFAGHPTRGSVPLTGTEVAAVIRTPTSWISDLDDWEIICLSTGDEWDRLTGAPDRVRI